MWIVSEFKTNILFAFSPILILVFLALRRKCFVSLRLSRQMSQRQIGATRNSAPRTLKEIILLHLIFTSLRFLGRGECKQIPGLLRFAPSGGKRARKSTGRNVLDYFSRPLDSSFIPRSSQHFWAHLASYVATSAHFGNRLAECCTKSSRVFGSHFSTFLFAGFIFCFLRPSRFAGNFVEHWTSRGRSGSWRERERNFFPVFALRPSKEIGIKVWPP